MDDLSSLIALLAFTHVTLKLWAYKEWERDGIDFGCAVIRGMREGY